MTNVRWFAQLGMADLEQVGGKNASLGEMVSNLSGRGRPGARRLRHHRRRLPRVHRRDRAGRADPPNGRRARHRRRRRAGRVGSERAGLGRGAAVPADLRERHPRGVRELVDGDPQPESCPSPYAPARPPRTCRTRRSPASRRPSSTSAASTPSCWRSARCSPRSTTTGRSPTACTTASTTTTWRCRPACSGWCAPTSAPPA